MGRQPCCEKEGLRRGPWTLEEDSKLMNFIINNGIQCWRLVPKLAGLMRCGKSCRLRWINYLRPDLKRGAFTEAEENIIIQLHSHLGNRWSKIAAHFPGRTDNEIKNHWNTRIKKKMKQMGLDPLTHKPLTTITEQQIQISAPEIKIENGDQIHQNLERNEENVTNYLNSEGGIINCDSNHEEGDKNNNDNNYYYNYPIFRNLDIGPSNIVFQMREGVGSFSMDPFQGWMDNNSFIWDGFSSLGDGNFP